MYEANAKVSHQEIYDVMVSSALMQEDFENLVRHHAKKLIEVAYAISYPNREGVFKYILRLDPELLSEAIQLCFILDAPSLRLLEDMVKSLSVHQLQSILRRMSKKAGGLAVYFAEELIKRGEFMMLWEMYESFNSDKESELRCAIAKHAIKEERVSKKMLIEKMEWERWQGPHYAYANEAFEEAMRQRLQIKTKKNKKEAS